METPVGSPRRASKSGDLAPTLGFPFDTSAPDAEQRAAALRRALSDRQRELDIARSRIVLLDRKLAKLALDMERGRRFAYYDELTALANRRLLADRFQQCLAGGARHHRQMAMLFLDLDGFKAVNDHYGHGEGDELLRQVAGRLLTCVRASDTVCRYGGDEFVVLLAEVEGQLGAQAVAAKIREVLARPYVLHGEEVTVGASLGIAVYPGDGASFADLLLRCDLAMYVEKSRTSALPDTHAVS